MDPRDPRHPYYNPYWNPYGISAPSTPRYEPRQGYFPEEYRRVSRAPSPRRPSRPQMHATMFNPDGSFGGTGIMPDGMPYGGMGPGLDPYSWTTFEDGRYR
jgi:hypothetical protein